MSESSLHTLIGAGRASHGDASVPRPRARWLARYVLPLAIVLIAAGVLVYAARDALRASVEVDVTPVVARDASGQAASEQSSDGAPSQESRRASIIAQAPGWIEPDPFAITVQPLISGVVEQVLVLEGQRVSAGEVIVRLIADDARLALHRAEAELAEHDAAVARSRADVATAEVLVDELRDELQRRRELLDVGGVSPGDLVRLEHQLRRQMSEVDAARAALRQAEAALQRQQVALQEADLALDRTVIRAPVDGVVLSRSVVPGTRVAAMAGDGFGEAHFPGVVRLYDPAKLQVRADVPLTDAAKVGLGTPARITTEALPEHAFEGEVTRIVHLADIQRNTVQVKVRINDPSPLLKPDMLSRVRFLGGADAQPEDGASASAAGVVADALHLYVLSSALINRNGERAQVWVAQPSAGGRSRVAQLRDIELGEADGELIRVRSGLQPGDRVITSSLDALSPGVQVVVRRQGSVMVDSGGSF